MANRLNDLYNFPEKETSYFGGFPSIRGRSTGVSKENSAYQSTFAKGGPVGARGNDLHADRVDAAHGRHPRLRRRPEHVRHLLLVVVGADFDDQRRVAQRLRQVRRDVAHRFGVLVENAGAGAAEVGTREVGLDDLGAARLGELGHLHEIPHELGFGR
eukprot:TRINITY_DN176_c0_g1_i4.p1 TRINITY_DN176_c0_g1~~TRINITY_DN176_c0_g1_i4.p1  ORF type:complete len:158 (+),score=11.58 TRINITY_DN176_c0_g1_i4:338-811(+)